MFKNFIKWLKGMFICTKCGKTYYIMTFGFGSAICPYCYDGEQFLEYDTSFILNRLIIHLFNVDKVKYVGVWKNEH